MTSPPPGLDLLRQVRVAFIMQGTTMKAWCRENNTHLSNVRNALIGSWNGPRGQAMRSRVIKASGWKAGVWKESA